MAFLCRRLLTSRSPLLWRECRSISSSFVASRADSGGTSKGIDEGLKLGDYPVLPWKSAQLNAPRGWWDNQDRRNKEDPIHEEEDALSVWLYDAVENNGIYTRWQALGQLLLMFGFLGGVYWLSTLYDAPSRNPAVPRQFPFNNLYLERGGDPNKPPSEQDLKEKVRSTYGEIVS